MEQRYLGHGGPASVPSPSARWLRRLLRRGDEDEGVRAINRASKGHHPDRHGRGLRRGTNEGWWDGRSRAARRGRARHEGRAAAARTTSAEASTHSLAHLGVDHVDVYYLHRVDARGADRGVRRGDGRAGAAGKIRHIGLSEAGAETFAAPTPSTPSRRSRASTRCCTATPRTSLPRSRARHRATSPTARCSRGLLTGRSAPPTTSRRTTGGARYPASRAEPGAQHLGGRGARRDRGRARA